MIVYVVSATYYHQWSQIIASKPQNACDAIYKKHVVQYMGSGRTCVCHTPTFDLASLLSGDSLEMPKFSQNLTGFWQIKMSKESSLPSTFNITPLGRYAFNRLPFGITSAPEHFQGCITEILLVWKGWYV